MTPEQVIELQLHERNMGRAFMPFEIQERFKLNGLKITYLIPEIDNAQSNHNQRIRQDFYKHGIYPKWLHLNATNVENVHAFDDEIQRTSVDYVYQGIVKKQKLRDTLDL